MRSRIVYVIVVVFLCCRTYCTEPAVTIRQPALLPAGRVLTLAECIDLALVNQSSIRLAQAQVQAQTGVVTQAKAALRPTASAATSTQVAGSAQGGTQITLSGNQLVYDFGKSRQLLTQAQQQRAASLQNLVGADEDLVLSVKQAYYTLLEDTHLVDVFTQSLTQQQAHVAETEAQEAVGVIPHANVLTAQAAAASARFDLVTAQNNANLARANLSAAMGIDLRSPIRVAETTEPAFPMPTEDQAVELAFQRRPEVRRDTDQVLAAQAAVKAAAVGNLPAVVSTADYTPNTGASSFGQQSSWALLLDMQWHFLDGGSTAGAVQQARAQVTTTEETLYADKQTIANEVVQARLNTLAAEAQLISATAEVASAKENLDAATGSYNAGVGIFLAVIDAQAALLKAQVDEYTACYGLSMARAALAHATGGAFP